MLICVMFMQNLVEFGLTFSFFPRAPQMSKQDELLHGHHSNIFHARNFQFFLKI